MTPSGVRRRHRESTLLDATAAEPTRPHRTPAPVARGPGDDEMRRGRDGQTTQLTQGPAVTLHRVLDHPALAERLARLPPDQREAGYRRERHRLDRNVPVPGRSPGRRRMGVRAREPRREGRHRRRGPSAPRPRAGDRRPRPGGRDRGGPRPVFRRLVFNVLVANRDDHLRNHGFLRTVRGWRLAPAFDVNSSRGSPEHTLAIDECRRGMAPGCPGDPDPSHGDRVDGGRLRPLSRDYDGCAK
jgi:HipA-like C-terminal domain